MLKFVVLFALFVVAALAQSSSQCLPAEFTTNVWGIPAVLDTPVDIQPGQFCNKNGDGPIQSCCDQATLDRYNEFWGQYKNLIDTQVDAFKTAAKSADASKLIYGALPAEIPVNALPQNIRDLLNDLVNAYKEFLKNGPSNFGKCLNGLQNYYQGILCGFCSPNWNDMVSVNSAGASFYTATFTLSDSTCDKLGDSCGTFIKSIYPVFTAVQKFVNVIVPSANLTGVFPCQDSNCPEFACDFLVRGFSVPQGNINFTDVAVGGVTSLRSFSDASVAMARNPFNVRKWFDQTAGSMVAQRQSGATVAQTNTYTEDGYDAYSAGAKAQFSAGASTTNSSAFAAVPSIFVALVALFFALF